MITSWWCTRSFLLDVGSFPLLSTFWVVLPCSALASTHKWRGRQHPFSPSLPKKGGENSTTQSVLCSPFSGLLLVSLPIFVSRRHTHTFTTAASAQLDTSVLCQSRAVSWRTLSRETVSRRHPISLSCRRQLPFHTHACVPRDSIQCVRMHSKDSQEAAQSLLEFAARVLSCPGTARRVQVAITEICAVPSHPVTNRSGRAQTRASAELPALDDEVAIAAVVVRVS